MRPLWWLGKAHANVIMVLEYRYCVKENGLFAHIRSDMLICGMWFAVIVILLADSKPIIYIKNEGYFDKSVCEKEVLDAGSWAAEGDNVVIVSCNRLGVREG